LLALASLSSSSVHHVLSYPITQKAWEFSVDRLLSQKHAQNFKVTTRLPQGNRMKYWNRNIGVPIVWTILDVVRLDAKLLQHAEWSRPTHIQLALLWEFQPYQLVGFELVRRRFPVGDFLIVLLLVAGPIECRAVHFL
ncbi:hypothetical protein T07_4235, partial [Trichinella nelsoni]